LAEAIGVLGCAYGDGLIDGMETFKIALNCMEIYKWMHSKED
jgi:hypothetical protein